MSSAEEIPKESAGSGLDFLTQAEEQICCLEKVKKVITNFKKSGKERITDSLIRKLSSEVEGVLGACRKRDVVLLTSDQYQESDYCKMKIMDSLEVAYKEFSELMTRATEKIATSSSNEPGNVALRSFHFAMVTELLTKYEAQNKEGTIDVDFGFILDRLEGHYCKFVSQNDTLLLSTTDPVKRANLQSECSMVTERLQQFFVAFEPSMGEGPVSNSDAQPQQVQLPSPALTLEAVVAAFKQSVTPRNDFHLPKIELPKFDGLKLKLWPDFKDSFESIIHSNPKLNDIERMHYLKGLLLGPAADTIKNCRLSQYSDAWDLLVRRYQNPKMLVFDALKELTSLSSCGEKSLELKRLIDHVKEIRFNLASLGEKVDEWNSIFVFFTSQRLPKDTFEIWEQSCSNSTSVPRFADLDTFIESRLHTIQALESRQPAVIRAHAAVAGSVTPPDNTARGHTCTFCHQTHANYNCPQLHALAAPDRANLVHRHSLCDLCLNDHPVGTCGFKWRCRLCKGKHNTLLHTVIRSHACNSNNSVLLPTAEINLVGETGRSRRVRVLIDQGSMASFISEDVAQSLQLRRKASSALVAGIGGSSVTTHGTSQLNFSSIFENGRNFSAEVYILPKLVTTLPEFLVDLPNDFIHLPLADREFWKGGRIDVILGADIYHEILMEDMIKSILLAQKTHLGWILSGCTIAKQPRQLSCYTVTIDQLDTNLRRFWETEERIVDHPAWTTEQIAADDFFKSTTTRDEDGRFICRLPLKIDYSLGESRRAALGNLFNLEKRFRKSTALHTRYVESMNDYFELGHAVCAPLPAAERSCFLPHLAVIKDDSLTTKTRVVFNASSKTANHLSLNDNLMVGPVIQRDLVTKILRFRLHPYVFICDIEKMYRQIKIHRDDWELQRFVWREREDEPIRDCCLTTVTFGQASAPFTATRALQMLAEDVRNEFPVAAQILLEEAYVDDIHFGARTMEDLLSGSRQLIEALNSASFSLRKWASNDEKFLISLPEHVINFQADIKFLGVMWNRKADHLYYPQATFLDRSKLTKRQLLADIASIFDPLGWIQPVVVPAKILMQSLWKQHLQWDEHVPEDILLNWKTIVLSLRQISRLSVPRWTNFDVENVVQLHGFCDASEKAYGAVVYLKTLKGVMVLCSKSRVSPIGPMTIPRLELKGAVLLADLITKVHSALDIETPIYCWCDSRVVLHWIKAEPCKWKPFIRNRTANINQLTESKNWSYVASADNPADLVSRGCSFDELRTSETWYNGPSWLLEWTPSTAVLSAGVMTTADEVVIADEILKSLVTTTVVVPATNIFDSLLRAHESFFQVGRLVAWMSRYYRNRFNFKVVMEATLTQAEIDDAEQRIVKHLQRISFGEDINRLQHGQLVSSNSSIRSLAPFLDAEGVLRVGGRVGRAEIPFDEKHPIILRFFPNCNSIISRYHSQVTHGGPLLTLCAMRKRFWLIHGIQHVKRFIHSCLLCHRHRPQLMQQFMADLPTPRVSYTKAFLHSGVDFAGPITMKAEVARGLRSYKAYIAVFVCLATKAIHLEVVGSLSTDSFLAALRRFVGRRGVVHHIYSDNGTNNVGAFRRLEDVQKGLSSMPLKWSFIPPAAPHFGGLWEAGVKSMKTQLKKVLGSALCTFEELATCIVQVEAVLNSRPLCPLSHDPEDLDVLTPMHFLTGHQYIPLEDEVENETQRIVTRYEFIQSKYHDICQRYKREYLARLQQRPKWLKPQPNIKVGQLVLVKEDNMITTRWPLGRVIAVHPGVDGAVRVVTLWTSEGTKKRPIAKISPLPVDTADSSLTLDIPALSRRQQSKK